MILVRALQANIQFLGQLLSSQWAGMPGWLGVYGNQGPLRAVLLPEPDSGPYGLDVVPG